MSRAMPRARWPRKFTVGAAAAVLVGAVAAPAVAQGGTIVSGAPTVKTPTILGSSGYVDAIDTVGSETVIGGDFTSGVESHGSTTKISQNYLFATDSSGTVSTTFRPTVNNVVFSVLADPSNSNEVYVGGQFTSVNGATVWHIGLLNVSTGATITSFKVPALNGSVYAMGIAANGDLILGGTFTKVGSTEMGGLAAVNSTSGALDTSYLPASLGVSGHFNYGVNCTSSSSNGCADGAVGVKGLAIHGDQMVIEGDFRTVGGATRLQVAMINLPSSGTASLASWSTNLYSTPCYYWAYDGYVRDVAWAPNGSYFVVASTGGGGTPASSGGLNTTFGCDSAAKFSPSSGSPEWVDYAGNDSISAAVVSPDSNVVYIGGHNRWDNNANGADTPGDGAIPHPGLAALDTANGMPYSWDPGRNPRGHAVYTMYIDGSGNLWIGQDTTHIYYPNGGYGGTTATEYVRPFLAAFPTGGEAEPTNSTYGLPGDVYLPGHGSSTDMYYYSSYSGSGKPSGAPTTTTTADPGGIPWNDIDGAFMVSGDLFYGYKGALYEATFDGKAGDLGTPVAKTAWLDPYWDKVQTGSGQTYTGTAPSFIGELSGVTGMFYADGDLFYTKSGSSSLYYRYFEPEDGAIGASEYSTSAPSGSTFDGTTALFASGSTIYWSNAKGLQSATLSVPNSYTASVSGPVTVQDSSTTDWASRGTFVGP